MRKYIRKIGTAAMLSLALVLLLAGCGHEHTWTDATCTEPKTCTECGETEGEALGHTWSEATCTAPKTCTTCGETEGDVLPHTWKEATCAAPKTCTVCGETEGEALPHTLTEANFQSAATCTVCGATVGEPLTPYFVEHEIPLMERGKRYDCILNTGNASFDTVAKVSMSVESYKVQDYYEYQLAKEGYEYRIADLKIMYSDQNALNYGVGAPTWYFEDYYDSELLSESFEFNVEGETGTASYNVNYNGEEQEACVALESEWKTGNSTGSYNVTIAAMVPVGYDGVIVGVSDSRLVNSDNSAIADDYVEGHCVLYRLD